MTTPKFASFEMDGNAYQVGYDANLMIEAEDASGCNLLAAMVKLSQNDNSLTGKELRALLMGSIVPWQGYPKGDLAKELEACGSLMRPDMIGTIKMALLEAMAAAISEEARQGLLSALNQEEVVPAKDVPAASPAAT
jgi:hypothetical protein